MKLAVVGSRSFSDYPRLRDLLDDIRDNIDLIISGGAAGTDSLAQRWCQERGVPILIFYPNWSALGKQAGLIRNSKIVDACDEMIAFTQGSSGTADSINKATQAGKKVHVYNF